MDAAPHLMTPDGTPKLQARVAQSERWLALRLDGIIDEHNRLDEIGRSLPEDSSARPLVIDVGGIARLNSVGVRDWVLALRALRERFRTIFLMDCTPAIMNEVNFVRNFAEGVTILTFEVPLYCTRCSREDTRTIATNSLKIVGGAPTLPSFHCDRSDCENALDDDESAYLAFVESQPSRTDGDALAQLAAEVRSAFANDGGQILAHHDATNGRSRRVGAQFLPTTDSPTPLETDRAAARSEASSKGPRKVDLIFLLSVGTMVVLLAVLVYLIATLE